MVNSKLLVLEKNKTNPTLLRCYQCNTANLINTPHFSFKVEGKMRSAFIVPELKVCETCQSFYMDIEKNEYWEFPNIWKKKFKNILDLEEPKNRKILKSLTKKKKGDLRKIFKCEKGHKLKLYDYKCENKCENCARDVAIVPL